jgi:hypothetical protein
MLDGVNAAPFAALQWGSRSSAGTESAGPPPWVRAVKKLLGASCYLMHTGVVMSLAGAEMQGIHPDGTNR